MFCDKCGTKLIEPNQKFCQKCGAIVKTTTTTSQSGSQLTIMSTQSSEQKTEQVSRYQQKLPIPGKIGMHSKRSLSFGITSLGSSITAIIFFTSIMTAMPPISISGSTIILPLIIAITELVLLAFPIVFGCLARSNGNKAEILESINGMQKAGKIMGLIGLIFISIVIGNIVVYDLLFFLGILRPITYYY